MACKMMDALSVVSQLRDLASEPQNREAIVKDKGCLPGLVLFLDHYNLQVLHCALQALQYLAECPSNRVIMRSELGMMNNLESLKERDQTSEDIRILATELYERLNKPLQTDKMRINNSSRTKKIPAHFFISSANKKAKTITLQIDGLHNMDSRNVCEGVLLQVNGVISFTFQMALQRCVVRIYSDLKIEAVVPLNTGISKAEQNLILPDYLPEDESTEIEHYKAISQTGAKGNTNGKWLNAAANFLTKTFYW
ncbi:armadillo repeat containing 1, like isoform X2 [Scyliorhinus canicula]|uniref:armadillo repeat containing 1, like isoform X2 n=1 Tax=Scyliorhinus canicula TaxID=7830 RepID=UPI0018F4720A|nr:armadillo repeat containing 1, like isoform X2 [Scyliorhinus canicula]